MELIYIQNARIPTEKANGYQIMKTCEALVDAGIPLELVVTNRATTGLPDPFVLYGCKRTFSITRLPVIDWMSVWPRVTFLIEQWTFRRSLKKWISQKSTVTHAYTREAEVAKLLKDWGVPNVTLELHAVPTAQHLQAAGTADGIVCLTRSMEQQIRQHLPKARTVVIPDSVDLALFDPPVTRAEARQRLGLPEDQRIIVYGGRFSTMEQGKGLAQLDTAVAQLATSGTSVRLYLVGGTRGEFETIEKRPPAATTACVAAVSRENLALYYRAADALVMPFPNTPHYAHEMSPLKMFEYMASGTPIVASDLPSIRDILDESSAYLYPADEPSALSSALAVCLVDTAKSASIAREARTRVERYTWQARALAIKAFIGI